MWEPIGPLPASVYRRRRRLAVAVAVGAVLSIGALVVVESSSEGPPDPATTETGPSFRSPEVAAMPVGSPVPAQAMPAAGAVPECADPMIAVRAEAEQAEHRVGQKSTFRLVVTNIGAQPCVRDLNSARMEVVVRSEDPATRLWSSDDCGEESTVDRRTLLPNQPLGFRVMWSGRTSTPGCTEKRVALPAGSYQVTARLDGVSSVPVGFRRLP